MRPRAARGVDAVDMDAIAARFALRGGERSHIRKQSGRGLRRRSLWLRADEASDCHHRARGDEGCNMFLPLHGALPSFYFELVIAVPIGVARHSAVILALVAASWRMRFASSSAAPPLISKVCEASRSCTFGSCRILAISVLRRDTTPGGVPPVVSTANQEVTGGMLVSPASRSVGTSGKYLLRAASVSAIG